MTDVGSGGAKSPAEDSAPANVELVETIVVVGIPADALWGAVRDFYRADRRLFPGIVARMEREGDHRVVTFANGVVVTERIVAVDGEARTLVYAAVGGTAAYHRASMIVVPEGEGASTLIWRTWFLPAELRPYIAQNMENGGAVMKRHLEQSGGATS